MKNLESYVKKAFEEALKVVKNHKEEIEEIDKAANISVDMHIAAMKMAKSGMMEREIAAEVQRIAQAAAAAAEVARWMICCAAGLPCAAAANTRGQSPRPTALPAVAMAVPEARASKQPFWPQ